MFFNARSFNFWAWRMTEKLLQSQMRGLRLSEALRSGFSTNRNMVAYICWLKLCKRAPPWDSYSQYIVIALIYIWDNVRENPPDICHAMGSINVCSYSLLWRAKYSIYTTSCECWKNCFHRERAGGMYSAFPYAFSQLATWSSRHFWLRKIVFLFSLSNSSLSSLLFSIFAQETTYSVIVHAMPQLYWTIAKLFWYVFFTYTYHFFYFTFFRMKAIALAPNQDIAPIITSACIYCTTAPLLRIHNISC